MIVALASLRLVLLFDHIDREEHGLRFGGGECLRETHGRGERKVHLTFGIDKAGARQGNRSGRVSLHAPRPPTHISISSSC
jgi:hypothetical protein